MENTYEQSISEVNAIQISPDLDFTHAFGMISYAPNVRVERINKNTDCQ